MRLAFIRRGRVALLRGGGWVFCAGRVHDADYHCCGGDDDGGEQDRHRALSTQRH